tara:strand:- start:2695 stop:3264 length:570 start_codon:yes stop_codon:yes gene_type:complete
MAFWGQGMDTSSADPKRKFRFKVEIQELGGGHGVWFAKTVQKPTLNISADTKHKYLGHEFSFPGSVTWDDIEVTLVDPAGDDDSAASLLSIVEGAGYKFPTNKSMLETVSKGKAVSSIKQVNIYQLDGNGDTIEQWSLHNPFINKVAFGDLSYEDDALTEITLGLTYDWAEFNPNTNGQSEFFEPPASS